MIQKIELRDMLPDVFRGSEADESVARSEVWLHDICFERGKSYLVEAESGAGKSSLCSFIYGSRSDYQGTLLFDGRDAAKFGIDEWCRLRRTSLALLPQEMRVFPELTALDNILIKNRLTDCMSESEIMDMLGRLEIAEKANVKAGHLSIGQQQRVAIVRALCQPFDFVILDEPVSHLDERNNSAVAAMIVERAKSLGASIIATSVGNKIRIPNPKILRL